MGVRHFGTKRMALKQLRQVTPSSYGVPNRKIIKRIWRTRRGWTGSVRVIWK